MKKIRPLLLLVPLLFSCEKALHVKTPDITIDGNAQTVIMKATPTFDIYLIWGWSYNENGDLVMDNYPLNETDWVSDFVGEWFEVHSDRENHQLARLTVSENNSGLPRKLTIEIQYKGKGDIIRITQNPL